MPQPDFSEIQIPQDIQVRGPRKLLTQNIHFGSKDGINGATMSAIKISTLDSNVTMSPERYAESLGVETTAKIARFSGMVGKIKDLENLIVNVDRGIDEVDNRLKEGYKVLDTQLQQIEISKLQSRHHGLD